MHRFRPWLLKRPIPMLVPLALVTALFLSHFRKLQFDTSPSTSILTDSDESRYYQKIARIFDRNQVLSVGLSGDNRASDAPVGGDSGPDGQGAESSMCETSAEPYQCHGYQMKIRVEEGSLKYLLSSA